MVFFSAIPVNNNGATIRIEYIFRTSSSFPATISATDFYIETLCGSSNNNNNTISMSNVVTATLNQVWKLIFRINGSDDTKITWSLRIFGPI